MRNDVRFVGRLGIPKDTVNLSVQPATYVWLEVKNL